MLHSSSKSFSQRRSSSSRARVVLYLYVSGTVRSNCTAYTFFLTEVYMALIQSTAHCGERGLA